MVAADAIRPMSKGLQSGVQLVGFAVALVMAFPWLIALVKFLFA